MVFCGLHLTYILGRILDYFVLYHSRMTLFINRSLSAMRSDIILPRSMKGGLEIFLGVSSLSHGFARALPYSAYLWKGGIEIF